jgi:hypothetical protein
LRQRIERRPTTAGKGGLGEDIIQVAQTALAGGCGPALGENRR